MPGADICPYLQSVTKHAKNTCFADLLCRYMAMIALFWSGLVWSWSSTQSQIDMFVTTNCVAHSRVRLTWRSAICWVHICARAFLQELSLAGNRLTTLPDAIGNLRSLQRLQMAGNLLTSLPDSICQLTDLEVSCGCLMGWWSWEKIE